MPYFVPEKVGVNKKYLHKKRLKYIHTSQGVLNKKWEGINYEVVQIGTRH